MQWRKQVGVDFAEARTDAEAEEEAMDMEEGGVN